MEMTHSPGNALIVSTQRLSFDSRAELFRCSGGRSHATMLCLQRSQMRSQMGADWTPDDLVWCGVVAWSALGLRGRGGREKREQGHQMPC